MLDIETNYRSSQPKYPGIKLKIPADTPDKDNSYTSHVKRLNLSVRSFNSRFERLCPDFSGKLANNPHYVRLHTMAYNFWKVHPTLKYVVAAAIRLTMHGAGYKKVRVSDNRVEKFRRPDVLASSVRGIRILVQSN